MKNFKILVLVISIILMINALAAAQWLALPGPGTGIYYSGGSMGLGTNAPLALLHVKSGNSGTTTGHAYSRFILEGSDHTMFNVLTPNNKWGYIGFGDNNNPFVAGMSYNHTSDLLYIHSNSGTRMYFDANGRVGIGVAAPGAMLDLAPGPTWTENGWRKSLKLSPASAIQLSAETNVFFGIGASATNKLFIFSTNTEDASGGSATYHMIIDNTGKIGIGRTPDSNRLAVQGSIACSSVTVNDVYAADFVFEPDYNLKPLIEVKRYIDTNGHLPGIASAKEMETKGQNLAEMNGKLLQKVEELTLYLIAQQQELDALKVKVALLENK